MPPRSAAELAVAAFLPPAPPVSAAGAAPQAPRASAVRTRPPANTAGLTKDAVTVSPVMVPTTWARRINLFEQVGVRKPDADVPSVNGGRTRPRHQGTLCTSVTRPPTEEGEGGDGFTYAVRATWILCATHVGVRGRPVAARHEEIAEELRRAIDCEEYMVGALLPSETELAARYQVSRGTVRQAVATLTAEGLIGSRQGARRVVLASRRSQSFAELRSFAEWARAMGREATGRVIAQEYRPASKEDSTRLQLTAGTPVLHVLRVRGLDGEPVLLERTVYADWISPTVESIEPECPSVTQRLYDDTGLVFAYGEHVIDAVAAGAQDAELLEVRRTSPLLRVRRVTTTREGRPVEWSDDRYRSDAVSFSVHNSIDNNALARKTAE